MEGGVGRGEICSPSITQCAMVMSTAEVRVRGRGGGGERSAALPSHNVP